jgi:hypothetical protein
MPSPALLWPPRSPDLTTCDNALRGYVKAKVAEHHMASVDEMKQPIQEASAAKPRGMLRPF